MKTKQRVRYLTEISLLSFVTAKHVCMNLPYHIFTYSDFPNQFVEFYPATIPSVIQVKYIYVESALSSQFPAVIQVKYIYIESALSSKFPCVIQVKYIYVEFVLKIPGCAFR